MKFINISSKAVLLASLCCVSLILGGCSGQSKTSTTAELNAFNGNPNSPEAQAAAKKAASENAARAAQAKSQSAPAAR